MFRVRKSADRGSANLGWLLGRHSFSFASYYDPEYVNWGNLRVINEDRIAPGTGFDTHGHRDMEIISYILSGSLEHKDNMGNSTVIPPGDVQRMSAGYGVMHSEYNPEKKDRNHFFQIWITPLKTGIAPSYEQKTFSDEFKRGKLRLIASPDGRDNSLTINADASLYAGIFDSSESTSLVLDPRRKAYVHVARGSLLANGQLLNEGDALLIAEEETLTLSETKQVEVLVFDLSA